MDRAELWHHLEESLTNLVDSMSIQISSRNRELLTHFIENREFGVALEWLHSLTVESNLRPSASQTLEIQRLAELMEIDLS